MSVVLSSLFIETFGIFSGAGRKRSGYGVLWINVKHPACALFESQAGC